MRRGALRGARAVARRRRLPLRALPAHARPRGGVRRLRARQPRAARGDALRWYRADGRERGFCATCGASLFWRADGRPTISIAAGTLDAPTGLRTVAHIYTRDQGDYYEIDGAAERHAGPLP